MKKILSLLAVIALLGVTGCGSTKTTTTACSANVSGMTDTMNIEAQDDKVTKLTEELIIPYTVEGIEEADYEAYEQYWTEMFAMMNDYTGITSTVSSTETGVIVTVVIDTTVASYDDLVTVGFAESLDQEVTYISLKESVSGFESQGYTCEQK